MFSNGVKAASGSPALPQDQGPTHQPYLVLHALVLGVTFRPFDELIRDLLTDSFYRSIWQLMSWRSTTRKRYNIAKLVMW
jgi:hypothetical protein